MAQTTSPLRHLVRKLRTRTLRWRYQVSRQNIHAHWKKALPGEVEFWKTFLSQRGGRWEQEFNRRVNPDEPLEAWVQQYLDSTADTVAKILDVGAGPLTILGNVWEKRRIHGEFNWSSQHLDDEVLRCRNGNGDGQTGRVGLRCVRLVGRR